MVRRKKSVIAVAILMGIAALFGCQCGAGKNMAPPPAADNKGKGQAGPSERDKIVSDFVADMDEAIAIVNNIKDKASAQKAIVELDGVTKKINDLTGRLVALGKRTADDQAAWGGHFHKIETATAQFNTAYQNLDPKRGKEIPRDLSQKLTEAVAARFFPAIAEFRKKFDSL